MTANNLLGQTLGPYTIKEILGSGGMAVVYRASQPQGEDVALKVLFPPPGTEAEILTRFEREANTAARLNHPSIVRVVDVGHTNDYTYLAMNLVEGETLTTRLARAGNFDEPTATDIAWQMADALYYAHSQGVVHRDVKPSNILLTTNNHALLTDFGVAQALDDTSLTRTGHTVGTPAYMAPEQATGTVEVDGRADIYSLGVVLYQMVTGRVPFEGSTPQILHAHVYDHPPAPSTIAHISPGLESVILKAMAKDVSERFQTGAAMAQALTMLDDQTGLQVPATPISTEITPEHSSTRLWIIGAVLLAIAVIGGLWWFTRPAANEPTVTLASQSVDTPSAATPTLTPNAATASATPIDLPYPTGSLLKGSGDGVFRVHADGLLQHIYDLPTFQAFGFSEDTIKTVDDSVLDDLPQEELTRLLQDADESLDWVVNGERWRIERWQKALAENGHQQLPPSKTDEILLDALPLAVNADELPEGTLLEIDDNVYRLFADGRVRYMPPDLIRDYGYDPATVIDIPTGVVHLYPRDEDLTPLLQAEDSDDIFLITNGQRQPMPPKGDELWMMGFALEDISQVPAEFLAGFPLIEPEATEEPTPLPPTQEIVEVTPTTCALSIDEALTGLTQLTLDEPLGCPRAESITTAGAWQPFENGLMLWRADSNLIYTIGPDESWFYLGDQWREGDEPYDPSIIVPEGYYQPVRGFGKVWQERPGVRADLGWALTEEAGITAIIQEFTDGQVWHSPEQDRFMILYNSGDYQIIQGGETIYRSPES